MKMKEVLQQTGLTDRAVRLYIDNSLVAPDIEENYSGRKNIEFSQADIDRLKNIALLRKIGFSIPDIKQLASGENTKSVIEQFIQQKQESIENDTLVLEQLKNISLDSEITLESLCLQLSSAAKNKQVPQEDLQLSKDEKRRREDYLAIAVLGLVSPVVIIGGTVLNWLLGHKHLVFEGAWYEVLFYFYGGWAVIFVLSLIMFFINKPEFVSVKKQKFRKHLSRVLFFIDNGFILWALLGSFAAFVGFVMVNDEYTTDPNDYLELDSAYHRYEDDIMKVFPEKIPESCVEYNRVIGKEYKSTTEYYFHQQSDSDIRFDLFAQWKLNDDEFLQEIAQKESSAVETMQKGDWTVCFYVGNEELLYEREGFVVAFAYNDITNTVRYIATFDAGYDGEYKGSYYYSLDW